MENWHRTNSKVIALSLSVDRPWGLDVFEPASILRFKDIISFFLNLALGFTSKSNPIIRRTVGLSAYNVQGPSEQTIAFISNIVHQALLTLTL